MFTSLPAYPLNLISDFGASRILSHACQRTWYVHQGRHAHYYVTAKTGSEIMTALRYHAVPLQHISLAVKTFSLEIGEGLSALKNATSLCMVSIEFGPVALRAAGAQALAALKDAPSLHTLYLSLNENQVGDAGALALAALKDAPSLNTL